MRDAFEEVFAHLKRRRDSLRLELDDLERGLTNAELEDRPGDADAQAWRVHRDSVAVSLQRAVFTLGLWNDAMIERAQRRLLELRARR